MVSIEYYEVTRRNGSKVRVSVRDFKKKFPRAGGTFQGRLEQLRSFVKDAKDWSMEEEVIDVIC